MVRHWTVFLAVALYAVVVGCTLFKPVAAEPPTVRAPTTFPAKLAEGLPIRAIGMQIQRVDWIERYKKSIDEIADVGVDAVKFVVDARQENGSSSRIYLDMRMTPTPEALGELIRYAKKRNLRVILMPIVLLDAPRNAREWRGRIEPERWDEWWKSYREMLNHFAWIAEGNGADVLVVGSELVSTENKTVEWTDTIAAVRGVFKGRLTYSANWDHYAAVKFWNELDFIGMNSYWTLGENRDVKIDEIKQSWRKIQDELFAFQKTVGKPLFFTEVGWCSMANMAKEPWDYTKDAGEAPTDPDLQKRLYEAFFQSWHGRPELGGFSIWEWDPDTGGLKDRGYTPKGKPAEEVLRGWLARKW